MHLNHVLIVYKWWTNFLPQINFNDYLLKKKIQFFSSSLQPYQNFALILIYYLLCAEGVNAFISKY